MSIKETETKEDPQFSENDDISEDILQDFSNRGIIKYSELSKRDLRSLIFHILYAYDSFDYQVSIESIIDNFNRGFELDIPIESEAIGIVKKVAESRELSDQIIQKYLSNWRLDRLSVSTKLILRLGIWELLNTDTPFNIVINEAIELAKCFSEQDSYKFINGILDEVAKNIEELKAANSISAEEKKSTKKKTTK